jgi:hypothetical protein
MTHMPRLLLLGLLAFACTACASAIQPVDGGGPPPDPSNCTAGLDCATGAPGICATGKTVCENGVSKCQTPVHSAFDNCFDGLDDNCDGLIDNGCPTSVSLGPVRSLTVRGGSGGGVGSVQCPTGAVVAQTQVWQDAGDTEMAGVSITCATPSLVKGKDSYTLAWAPITPNANDTVKGTKASGLDNNPEYACGPGSVGWYINGYVSSSFVDGLGAGCAWPAINLSTGNQLDIQFIRIDNGGADTYYKTTAFEDACAPNELIVGYNLRFGAWLDSIQAVCAPLVVNYD